MHKDIVDNIIAARNRKNRSSKRNHGATKEKAFYEESWRPIEIIQDWIEMNEDTEDLLPSYQEIHRRVTSAQVRATFLVQSFLTALLSDCASYAMWI